MNENEKKVLETAALLYGALPEYLLNNKNKQDLNHLVIDLIDALDTIEYSRSASPFFDVIDTSTLGPRKSAILKIEKQYNLTDREKHILRYLANDRNPTYIANALNISQATAKAHKYSIFKKLGVHSTEELKDLLQQMGASKE